MPESQLQGFRCFRNSEGAILYELKCFPGPKKGFLLGLSADTADLALWPLESAEEAQVAREGYEVASDPVQLYLRAHVVNQRVLEEQWHELDHKIVLSWRFQGARVSIEGEGSNGRWTVSVEREGQKIFRRQVSLGKFSQKKTSSISSSENSSQVWDSSQVRDSKELFLRSKDERLLERVQGDVDASREGLDRLQCLCAYLEAHPEAWGASLDEWPLDAREALQWMQSKGKVPSFQLAFRAEAFELFHESRRRYQRKLLGAQKRLADLTRKRDQGLHITGAAHKRNPTKQGAASASQAQKDSSDVGLCLIHPSGLRARLGRNRRENAELFRRASSRDLWFHVRGLGGSHVWIPRGQELFGAKVENLREDLIQWAAQLAVYNSKARASGHGVVDYTEKRHLKAAKGEEGTLLIQRSQTRMVELDEGFEKWLRSLS